jgi:very-short-patch-repair endonuclease
MVAELQHGVITRAQALAAGMSSEAIARHLESGLWFRVAPGVFVVAGSPPSWEQSLWIAHCWAGKRGALGGETAAILHGLDGIRGRPVEVLMNRRTRAPSDRFDVRYSRRWDPNDAVTITGLRVTSVPRTLLDLAARSRPWTAEIAFDSAVRDGITSLERVDDYLGSVAGRGCDGTSRLRAIIDARRAGDGPMSPLETRLDAVLTTLEVPPFERQFEVRLMNGEPVKIDFAWPPAKVGAEGDGKRSHTGAFYRQRDLTRQNALAEVGWLLLRFTWYDVTRRPDYVVEKVGRVVRQRTP